MIEMSKFDVETLERQKERQLPNQLGEYQQKYWINTVIPWGADGTSNLIKSLLQIDF